MIVLGCEEKTCVNYDKPERRLLCQNCSRNFEDKFESPNSRQQKFKKLFPNVSTSVYAIDIKPCIIDTTLKYDGCEIQGCGNCRRVYWREEEDKC